MRLPGVRIGRDGLGHLCPVQLAQIHHSRRERHQSGSHRPAEKAHFVFCPSMIVWVFTASAGSDASTSWIACRRWKKISGAPRQTTDRLSGGG